MAVEDRDLRPDGPEGRPGDPFTRNALLGFAGACLAVTGIFLAFPGLWEGLHAASLALYESKVVSAILCRP